MQKKGNLTCSKNYTEIESVIKKVKMKIKFLYKQPSICVKTNKNNFTGHPLTILMIRKLNLSIKMLLRRWLGWKWDTCLLCTKCWFIFLKWWNSKGYFTISFLSSISKLLLKRHWSWVYTKTCGSSVKINNIPSRTFKTFTT